MPGATGGRGVEDPELGQPLAVVAEEELDRGGPRLASADVQDEVQRSAQRGRGDRRRRCRRRRPLRARQPVAWGRGSARGGPQGQEVVEAGRVEALPVGVVRPDLRGVRNSGPSVAEELAGDLLVGLLPLAHELVQEVVGQGEGGPGGGVDQPDDHGPVAGGRALTPSVSTRVRC